MKKKKNTGEVGFGKPPKHSQFQKGTSGNPKGRPPKPRSFELFEDAIRTVLLEEVSINGETKTKCEAVALSIVNDAIRGKGNARAILMPMIQNLSFGNLSAVSLTALQEDERMCEDIIANHKPLEEEEP